MIDKLLQCLFKGFERGPRTLEEALMVIDEEWEKKRSDIVKRRLKNKLCIVCGSDCKDSLSSPSAVRTFQLWDTKYRFWYILCFGCDLHFEEKAYYASFTWEDVDANVKKLLLS